MRSHLQALNKSHVTADQKTNDAVLALMALGFKQNDAYESVRAALTLLGGEASVENIVRACLKKGA